MKYLKKLLIWIKNHSFIRIQFLHVFENDVDWYVAFDEGDAIIATIEETNCELEDVSKYWKINDLSLFTINQNEAVERNEIGAVPIFSRVFYDERNGWRVSAPIWAWILFNGRGFLCSTEY